MSFYTGLTFYRPRKPPAMTAGDLGRFVAQIRDAGLLADRGLQYLKTRVGDSIDQDDQGTTSYEEAEGAPGAGCVKEIEWDLELARPSGVAEIIAALAGDNRRIVRRNRQAMGLVLGHSRIRLRGRPPIVANGARFLSRRDCIS
jgi:hypothetical protein